MDIDDPVEAQTIIDTLLKRTPQLAEVFNSHGMACVGCVFSRFHSLADAAQIYHIDVEQFIKELLAKRSTKTHQD